MGSLLTFRKTPNKRNRRIKTNDPTAVSIGDIRAWQYQIEFMYFEKIYLIHNIDGIILILIGIFRRNAAYE